MASVPSDPPHDLAALEDYLLSPDLSDETMLLSTLDGFLTAIAVSPNRIPPGEWLPEIWGGTMPPLALAAATSWVIDAIKAHCKAIELVLARAPLEVASIFDVDTDEAPLPEGWAEGFMRGVHLRRQDWAPLFDRERWNLLFPIAVFAGELDGEGGPIGNARKRRDELRHDALVIIRSCVVGLHAFWQTYDILPVPPRRKDALAKVGRNDPCPCGSGKKYKKCCGQ